LLVREEALMTRDEALAFFQRRQRNYDLRDPVALTADHAPDGIVRSPMFPRATGSREIEHAYRALFATFPDWQIRLEDPILDEDRAAQFFVVNATHVGDFMGLPGSGRRFEIQGALLFRLKDGLIADERRVYDFTALLMQLGVLRGKLAR
jgi:steroid delta-isomerase-like uncharacterized protein